MAESQATTNRLAGESSPYLRQHATNPVDWYPWCDEALQRARRENKPIFLSVGYAACHWCHVMEHESFADPETAAVMNQHFINIKVDREERPDIDQTYMNAVLALRGQGGWPMSVFLTPDLEPFYVGTYFPPTDRFGMPSFRRVLEGVAQAWRERRDDIRQAAEEIARHLREGAQVEAEEGDIQPELLGIALHVLERSYDSVHGGFGQAPKFPHAIELRLLLRLARRFDYSRAIDMVQHTLRQMARGGIYDHLGGGFHRYSTDAQWLVPHFEKMLYDNALLGQAYLEAFQVTGEPTFRRVVDETLAWVEREMTHRDGGFYSTLDADSDGHEGRYYTWTYAEVADVLGAELAELFASVYDVSDSGNWEGVNILHRSKSDEQDAALLGITVGELRQRLAEARRRLLEARSRRTRPATDNKIITAWNGLMISTLALAGQVLGNEYADRAARAAEFLLTHLRDGDGRLMRTWAEGFGPRIPGYLEDYASLIDALITLYETTFSPRWLQTALELTDIMCRDFWDESQGGFYFTSPRHDVPIARSKDPQDSSTPSGNAMAVLALLRLAKLTGQSDLEEKAVRTLQLFRRQMARMPMAFGQMLIAADFYLGPVDELAVIGRRDDVETQAVLRRIHRTFQPHRVIAFADEAESAPMSEAVPLLAGRTMQSGRVTIYLCRGHTCQEPIVGLEGLTKVLPPSPIAHEAES